MKKHSSICAQVIRTFALALAALCTVLTLAACGSDLDGTWRSRSDRDTRIRFSGENVRITYDGFRIEGTYEIDDSDNIVFHLTDKDGNKYKINARIVYEKKKKLLTLTNAKGESEIFEK